MHGFKRVYRTNRDLTESEEATVELWNTRQSELEELLQTVESGSDEESSFSDEYDELNKVMAAFEEQLLEWGDVKNIGGVYAYVETLRVRRLLKKGLSAKRTLQSFGRWC